MTHTEIKHKCSHGGLARFVERVLSATPSWAQRESVLRMLGLAEIEEQGCKYKAAVKTVEEIEAALPKALRDRVRSNSFTTRDIDGKHGATLKKLAKACQAANSAAAKIRSPALQYETEDQS